MKKVILPGLLAGLVMLAISMGVSMIMNVLVPSLQSEYNNADLFRPWSDPIMSLYYAYPFVLGIALAWFWDKTKSVFKDKSACRRGAKFGLAYWVAATIPGMLVSYSSFQVSLLMITVWAVSGLINAVTAGAIFAKMNK
ncbi:hypothetical protein COS83_03110 [archaeon CG07_land_8_20_14_0_80_38_8]|nr:MAG: hypothetical protein COS83_03110 [archaeon CG07_land_8_20_14_0_80_38_8]PIU89064.1 MAG: hypothetical protein COS64_01805 [archaeon CG06_land_8_20_14_3_00_37_11]